MLLRRLRTWFYICAAIAAAVYMFWPTVKFSFPLANALQRGTIERIEVLRCPGWRGSLPSVANEAAVIDFYKDASAAAEGIKPYKGCDKRSFTASSIIEATGNRIYLPMERFSRPPMIVTDAIFFYDPSEDQTYAIYYWQASGDVLVRISKGKPESSITLHSIPVLPNAFTKTLNDKFIVKYSTQWTAQVQQEKQ